jgi:hypothetical protein
LGFKIDFISNNSQAAQQARSQMGTRKYFNLVIQDTLQEQQNGKIGERDNVVSLRDYMQVKIKNTVY